VLVVNQGAVGLQGSTGAIGLQGSTGAQGASGEQGAIGLQGATIGLVLLEHKVLAVNKEQ
jgi:hypothetical protein